MNQEVIKALAVMAALYGRADINEDAARMLADDLSEFEPAAVLNALKLCRRELARFPTVADIVSRIDDGRPGVEEAWAMLPLDETDSAVWTEEMQSAFGSIRGLLNSDRIAARMAFREIYPKLVTDARNRGLKVNWTPTLGHDKTKRQAAVTKAVELGRLTQTQAAELLPDPVSTAFLQLVGPSEPGLESIDVKSAIAKIREQVEKGRAP